jgi:Uma2 family endonuclease
LREHTGKAAGCQAGRPSFPVSFEQFLVWADERTLTEWLDRRLLVMSPASADHQRVRDFLLMLPRLFVEARGLGEVFSAPFVETMVVS